jgi:hypothetical protein
MSDSEHKWLALVDTIMNPQSPQNVGRFLEKLSNYQLFKREYTMELEYLMTNKGKVIPVPKNYTIKLYRGSGDRHPWILNIRSRWERVMKLMHLLFPPGYKEK